MELFTIMKPFAVLDQRYNISTNSARVTYRTAVGIHAEKMRQWARRRDDDIAYAVGINDQPMMGVGADDRPDLSNSPDRKEGDHIYLKQRGWLFYFESGVIPRQEIGRVATTFREGAFRLAEEKHRLSASGGLAQAVRQEALKLTGSRSITKQRSEALAAAYEMERLARLAEIDAVYVSLVLKR